MIHKKEITQFAKRVLRSQKGLRNHQLMHPRREWLTGIVIAVIIFSGSITWSSMKYFEYQNIEEQSDEPLDALVVVYRETLVAEALAAQEVKAQRLNTLLKNNPATTLESNESAEVLPEESGEAPIATTTDELLEPVATSGSSTDTVEPTQSEPVEDTVQDLPVRPATNI
jgi:hypothetical protein